MVKYLHLSLDKNDIEEILKVVSDALANEKLLELEQECIPKEEAGGKGNYRRRKRRTPPPPNY